MNLRISLTIGRSTWAVGSVEDDGHRENYPFLPPPVEDEGGTRSSDGLHTSSSTSEPATEAESPSPFADLRERWSDQAEQYGQDDAMVAGDRLIERMADEAQQAFWKWWTQPLGISEAADWSSYTEDHLRRRVREGGLPQASDTLIRVRRCDLPTKADRTSVDAPPPGEVPSRMQVARSVVDSD